MTSEIRANTLKNRVGLGTISFTNTGPVVSGIITSLGADINGDLDVDGVSTFSDHVSIPDDKELRIGNSADLKLVHTTSLSSISSGGVNNFTIRQSAGSGFLFIHGDQLHLRSQSTNEPYLIATNNGPVSLYYDQNNHNTAKLATTATGVTIDGTAVAGGLDISGDIDVDGHTNLDNVSVAGVTTFAGDIRTQNIFPSGSNLDIGSSSNPFRDIHLSNDLSLIDSGLLKLGTHNDFLIQSTGNNNFIEGGSGFSGNLYLRAKLNQEGVKIESDGAVTLHHSGSAKLVTSSGGVGVTGDITVSGSVDGVDIAALNTTVGTKLANIVEDTSPQLGADLQGNGYHIRLTDTKYVWFGTTGTGIAGYSSGVYFEGNSTGKTIFIRPKLNQESIKAEVDGSVSLYHSGTEKFQTIAGGVEVTNGHFIQQYGGISSKIGYISGGAEAYYGTTSNHALFIGTAGSNRIKISNSSAATSIGGSMVFNAMLTVQGDVSGAIFTLKAAENTNRLMVAGSDSNGVEINLYDDAGGQKGILGVSGTEFFIKAPNSSAPMTFYTHNGSSIGERLRIKSSGEVGINNTNPQSRLEVAELSTGQSETQKRIAIFRKNGTTVGDEGYIHLTTMTGHYGIKLGYRNEGGSPGYLNQGFFISTVNSGENITNHTKKFVIKSDGKTSVGHDDPDRALHVKSGANSNDGAFRIESAPGNIMDMGTDGSMHFLNCVNNDPFRIKFAGNEAIRVTQETSGNWTTSLQFYMETNNGQGASPYIKGVAGTESGGIDAHNAGGFEFHTRTGGAGTDVNAMRIDHNGRVSIGAHNIQSVGAALHIIGDTSGSNTALQVGQDSGSRYFRVNELNGQSNFSDVTMSFYDNSLRNILILQNTFAAAANYGTAIQFIGHGGSQTGKIAVKNRDANSASNSIMELNASYVTKPNQPSFAAYYSGSTWNVNGNYMVFNTTRHNTGNHYDTSNGRFTAPVAGSYQINFYSIYRGSVTNAYVQVYVNGARIYGGDNHFTNPNLGSNWETVSYCQTLYLSQDDYVQMYSPNNIDWHGNHWQCFSGFLIG